MGGTARPLKTTSANSSFAERCPFCGRKKKKLTEEILGVYITVTPKCDCEIRAFEREMERFKQHYKLEARRRLLAESGLTGNASDYTFENFLPRPGTEKALAVARYFYEKLNRIDDARQVLQLQDLLIALEDITVDINLDGLTEQGRVWFNETLRKREARLRGKGGEVIELYRPLPVDEDDPNEVSADREITRIAREYARDMKKGNE